MEIVGHTKKVRLSDEKRTFYLRDNSLSLFCQVNYVLVKILFSTCIMDYLCLGYMEQVFVF